MMASALEVRPLRGEEVSRLSVPWTPLFRARTLGTHIERHPHLAFWVPATGDWIVGGYWRGRRDIGVLMQTSGPRHLAILVARLLAQFREEGCEMVVLSQDEAEAGLGWYRGHGWQVVDRLVVLRRSVKGLLPRSGRLPAISSFQPEDLEELTGLDKAAFPWLWWNHPADFLAYTASASVGAFVSRLDGRLVGYVSYTAGVGRGHLDRLAVHPSAQRQGYGRGLLSFTLEQMRRAGVREIGLTTQRDNLRAQHLYEKLGFTSTGETYELYGFWLNDPQKVL